MIGRMLRTIAFLSAVASATMPGMLAVGEGVIEAAAAGATGAHVEPAGGSESCPVAHGAHCAACSMLRHGYTAPELEDDVRVYERCIGIAPAARALAGQERLHSSGSPRAPPAA